MSSPEAYPLPENPTALDLVLGFYDTRRQAESEFAHVWSKPLILRRSYSLAAAGKRQPDGSPQTAVPPVDFGGFLDRQDSLNILSPRLKTHSQALDMLALDGKELTELLFENGPDMVALPPIGIHTSYLEHWVTLSRDVFKAGSALVKAKSFKYDGPIEAGHEFHAAVKRYLGISQEAALAAQSVLDSWPHIKMLPNEHVHAQMEAFANIVALVLRYANQAVKSEKTFASAFGRMNVAQQAPRTQPSPRASKLRVEPRSPTFAKDVVSIQQTKIIFCHHKKTTFLLGVWLHFRAWLVSFFVRPAIRL